MDSAGRLQSPEQSPGTLTEIRICICDKLSIDKKSLVDYTAVVCLAWIHITDVGGVEVGAGDAGG